MKQTMLIESNVHQTRIGVMEGDRLTEIFVEQHRHRGLVGNVYKGRITRVLPGMQAAFVDIGLERDAFLYVRDVRDPSTETAVGSVSPGLAKQPAKQDPSNLEERLNDDLDSDDPDSHELDSEELDSTQTLSDGWGRRDLAADDHPAIDDLVKLGQELVVQVVKDPLPNKGARITTHVTLPGRYLVLLPTVRHFGVSRRIDDETERERLLELLAEIGSDQGGLIVRTVGEGEGLEEFRSDRDLLSHLWRQIHERSQRVKAPTLLHRDHDLSLRTVRDLFRDEFSAAWVEGGEAHGRIVEFLRDIQPALASKVKRYREEQPLFERFGIESQIEAALKPRVWLKSGGYLVINPTEALVAIDINTGRFVGKHNLEETVRTTNLEAVSEIVRQIRLRDLGGIIVIDFIDMTEAEHRDQVFEALERELEKDRAKTKVLSISEFGLVELTRKRSRVNLERLLREPCPYCRGSGRVKTVTTVCLSLRRELLAFVDKAVASDFVVRAHPEIVRALQQEERTVLDEVERVLGQTILLTSDDSLHREVFEITPVGSGSEIPSVECGNDMRSIGREDGVDPSEDDG